MGANIFQRHAEELSTPSPFFLNWVLSAFEIGSHQACVINSAYNVPDVGLLLQDVAKHLFKIVVYKSLYNQCHFSKR